MTTLTESTHAGEFLISEEDNCYSRDAVTVVSGQNLKAGAVLGKITASGKWAAHDPAASDGSQNAAGVLFEAVDATVADKIGVVIQRVAQVNGDEILWKTGITAPQKTAGIAALAAIGVIVRVKG